MNLLDIFLEKRKIPSIAVSILPEVAKQAILQNQLPRLNTNNIFLKSGEYCCYIDKTILLIDKTRKIYQHRGGSAPGLFKGTRVTWGSGQPVEYTETQQVKGILYITNKRKSFAEICHRKGCLIVADGNLVYHVLKMVN